MWKIILSIIGIVIAFSILSFGCHWFDNGAQVTMKEYSPEAMLWKYEDFIDRAQRITAMEENIKTYRQNTIAIKTKYETDYGKRHELWDPMVQQNYQSESQIASQQLVSSITLHNKLVTEYDGQSKKFNWAPFKTKANCPTETFEQLE